MSITSNGREFVWDDYLIDTERTCCKRSLHSPVLREKVFDFDAPHEGNGCNYFCIVKHPETGIYRMYYNAMHMKVREGDQIPCEVKICCIESADGKNWTRPDVGRITYNGSNDNNIVLNTSDVPGIRDIDNFFVMYDSNPNPVVKEKYKAVMQYTGCFLPDGRRDRRLISLLSEDGYNFRVFGTIYDYGTFDSLNTVHYNTALGKYVCFYRSLHDKQTKADYDRNRDWNDQMRDIRVTYSKDFINWTEPERIEYSDGTDIPMYTNCAIPYPGAEHMIIAFPTRYTERKEWSAGFDGLCGKEQRLERMKMHPRYGLAVTDCLFMCTRDGKHFTRYTEPFMKPGPEHPNGWVYGNCYPAVGLIETPGLIYGTDDEWSIYDKCGHWVDGNAILYRSTIRKDGFVSFTAGSEEKVIHTKPFSFTGSKLKINFSTSAAGYLKIRIIAKDKSIESCELFGDSVNREVDFGNVLSELSGKEVTMEIRLKEADFYAWEFV